MSGGFGSAGFDVPVSEVALEYPAELSHGDFACTNPLKISKNAGISPRDIADRVVKELSGSGLPPQVKSVSVAGPGFINIQLSSSAVAEIIHNKESRPGILVGKKIMVEYTDPNPFKEFHIGHLMNNAIGESLSRIAEANGADVVRACYQGDVGPHIAKCLWGMMDLADEMPTESDSLDAKTAFIGRAYAHGAAAGADNPEVAERISQINTAIYAKTDPQINALYATGRTWCLDQFDKIYEKLGTKFDAFYFESDMAGPGMELVRSNIGTVFSESDDAVVYAGEQDGLHTRVFITKTGNPTYEAKDLANNRAKFRDYPVLDESIIITANEQNEYFRVMFAALNHINPEIVSKSHQYGHGMMLGSDGKKMSSRKGTVLTGGLLIDEVVEMITEKSSASEYRRELSQKTLTDIAVGAIKYSILKQTIGKNIVFDFATSLSFEGDSGPYLQYTHARLCSLIQKAALAGIASSETVPPGWQSTDIERILSRSAYIIERAWIDKSPQQIVAYCVRIAQVFNSWYAFTKIIDTEDATSGYKIAIVECTKSVLAQHLTALGIVPVEEM